MPEQPDDYQPTEADLDLVIEEATGKVAKPADLAAGIASLRQRITQLEAEKARLLDQLARAAAENKEGIRNTLAATKRDIVTARERLTHYEAQVGRQN